MTKKYFDRLKPATRRMKIAKDVLATLALPKRKRFKPTSGDYCDFNSPPQVIRQRKQLQALLPQVEKDCTACAMGALFLSHVRLVNNFSLAYGQNSVSPRTISATLADYFPEEQLRTIEAAFEDHIIGNVGNKFNKVASYCLKWKALIPNDEPRLKAIMRNIVKHKGDFDITDLPKPSKKRAAR